MKTLKKYFANLLAIVIISTAFIACGGDSSSGASTAPSPLLEIQANYKTQSSAITFGVDEDSDTNEHSMITLNEAGESTLEKMVEINKQNIQGYKKTGENIDSIETADETDTEVWDREKTYAAPGTKVKYAKNSKFGIFVNAYWTKGNEPSFKPNYGPWKLVKRTTDNTYKTIASVKDTVEEWDESVPYSAGDLVKVGNAYYRALGWSQGSSMKPTDDICATWDDSTPGCKQPWQSPWKRDDAISTDTTKVVAKIEKTGGGKPDIEKPPVAFNTQTKTSKVELAPKATPVVPPVAPAVEAKVEPKPAPAKIEVVKAVSTTGKGDGLPASGYEFLREVSNADWDWLFPMRSGRYNQQGGTRNKQPFAKQDGSTDTFSLANFKKAVLEYNAWAKANGYKQFLNEGTKKQQAQEFLLFWAKSSRETSGSWSTAKEPWIVTNEDGTKTWKGALYWVEEVGYSTKDDGTSTAIGYVDAASSYKPVAGRSYYGRGVIQLSWNYNYGAFSAWMYDNGLFKDVITSRDTLLKRPDYVAKKGELSILSGIWFWMTPQGAKPSSHDVLYGDITHVSQRTQDRGLPQRNDGGDIPTAKGDTNDQAVMAYRIGTIINIVNGGLECNRASKWHGGPPQRVSYYNAYTAHFNKIMPGLDAVIVDEAVNVWNTKISDSSDDILKSATCYNQKSYYGW